MTTNASNNQQMFYKAVRPDGASFHDPEFRWIPEDGIIPEGGWLVEHPNPGPVGDCDAGGYLSVATIPTNCAGMRWPSRLLRVEPVGEVWTPHPERLPRKRAAHAWRVVEEQPAHEALGPQGWEAAVLIESAHGLTPDQLDALAAAGEAAWGAAWEAAWYVAREAAWYVARDAAWEAAWGAARGAAWEAAWYVAREAAWYVARDAAWYVARDAVLATIVRDLISPAHYTTLIEPWRTVMGDLSNE